MALRSSARPILHVLRLDLSREPVHIFKQLQIEEALFRADDRNWCVVNRGGPAPCPAIVLGISGKPDQLCNTSLTAQRGVPLFKRFTGGGTVVIDENTNFFSLICSREDIGHSINAGPRELMEWTGTLYGDALEALGVRGQFRLRENDYVFGDHKFAGNAQSISKERVVHHTSLLWKFDDENMKLLLNPAKQPDYRKMRDHGDFLVPLSHVLPSRDSLDTALLQVLGEQHFQINEVLWDDPVVVDSLMSREHRRSNKLLSADGVWTAAPAPGTR